MDKIKNAKSGSAYERVLEDLRRSYDHMVEERDMKAVHLWKIEERDHFLSMLKKEDKKKLLEIGAGTGVHGKYFRDQGIEVICTDLSTEMVKRCRENGLEAYEMDFLNLDFSEMSFDATFGMNCLLHVPRSDLPSVLEDIRRVLQPGGLFYWGQYGGIDREGIGQKIIINLSDSFPSTQTKKLLR